MEIHIKDLSEIEEKALEFVRSIGDARVLAFHGKMGAGKTTFIKALCHVLGVREAVTSPTFAIVNEYAGQRESVIYHFDFYRIRRVEEAIDMGIEDYLYSGHLCLIEWPELIEDLLPEGTLHVTISEEGDGGRLIRH